MKKIATVVALGMSLCATGCGGDGKIDVKGEVTIADRIGSNGGIAADSPDPVDGGSCYGTGGYDDIAAGADVVVHDSGNIVIGSSTLGSGTLKDVADLGGGTIMAKCVFPYEVKDVEGATERGNSVTVGHKRKGPAFTKDELGSGHAGITIGSAS